MHSVLQLCRKYEGGLWKENKKPPKKKTRKKRREKRRRRKREKTREKGETEKEGYLEFSGFIAYLKTKL